MNGIVTYFPWYAWIPQYTITNQIIMDTQENIMVIQMTAFISPKTELSYYVP
jgi:hypothetical protein